MIIERHKLIGQLPVKRRVPKVTKIELTKNGVDMNGQDVYDTVMAYCQSCGKRIDIPVVHDEATNNQFQLISVPKEIAYKLENYKAYCNQCGKTNIIERQNHVNRYEVLTIKLDFSKES